MKLDTFSLWSYYCAKLLALQSVVYPGPCDISFVKALRYCERKIEQLERDMP